MEGTWICPQCETSNENTDKCIVCGMDYASAVMIYKKYSTEKIEEEKVIKKSPTETKKKSVDTSKIKLRFKDEDTVIAKTPPPKEKNVYAIISIVVGIIGMLLSILVNPLGLLMAGTGIALGIVSVKIEIKPIGVVGMIVSLLCCIIAAILVI